MIEYYKEKNGVLYHGDCLEVMGYLESQGTKFDLILTDPPYGITACKWDSVIPLDEMWNKINKIIYDTTPIALFGSEPFSSKLRLSNLKNFKYDWIWYKSRPTGISSCKYRPMKNHEIISLFYNKKTIYNPIYEKKTGDAENRKPWKTHNTGNNHGLSKTKPKLNNPLRNPTTIKYFPSIAPFPKGNILHPTQKPVPLYEYLIKTYTKENDLVLDFCAGSGTLAMACNNLGRRWVMIDKEEKYCDIIVKRLNGTK